MITISITVLEFGYDEVHDDYKVVGIFYTSTHGYVVYSLKTESWRRLDDVQGGILYHRSAKLVNRKFHWETMRVDGWGITSVDLVDEKCQKVELPCCKGYFYLTLGVLGSELSVFCNYDRTRADVWVMKEYGAKES
nr:F-box/kelch-repeat protein At3g23880-like [Nicotiana tomentosiformis]